MLRTLFRCNTWTLAWGMALALPAACSTLKSRGCGRTRTIHSATRGTQQVAQLKQMPKGLSFGVATPNVKIRPSFWPAVTKSAELHAGRNEFEPFQLAFISRGSPTKGLSVRLETPLTGPDQIPTKNVTLYRVAYYRVNTASNSEGAPGLWPDALIPDVDTYVGEKRNAFPFDLPPDQSRVVWVDILVPHDAKPGRYRGALSVYHQGGKVGVVPMSLEVGDFTLPSTATLHSAYGLTYSQPCMAHTGTDTCDKQWNETAAYRLRERYVRSALEHRFTISEVFFQPPSDDMADFEREMLPLVQGRGKTRLKGARVTQIRVQDAPDHVARWVDYAKRHGFADRLYYYPVDEPGDDEDEWNKLRKSVRYLRAHKVPIKTILTAPLEAAKAHGAADLVDIFVPVLESIHKPPTRFKISPSMRPKYEQWRRKDPKREVWAYQSCMSHGCGDCNEPTTDAWFTGWPNRVIDSSAVQDRAFPWIAFTYDLQAELYFAVAEQLTTAWEDNGQCKFSGSGDGTIFYPGRPSIIGGKTDIPVESIRIKMIREGMEDYEYLVLARKRDPTRAKKIAEGLFPTMHQTAQPAAKLEAARRALFELVSSKGSAQGPAAAKEKAAGTR